MSDILDETRYQAEHAYGLLPRQRWKAAADEIKLLRDELDLANGRLDEKSRIICDMNQELAEKDKTIEELEDELNEEHTFLSDCDVIITVEQIDAMWKYINRLKIAGDNHCSSLAVVIKEVLALAGIVSCEECEGMGNYQEIRNFNWTECESCDGHGWIVK